ncbi:hypothetical protein ACHWQZ_G001065 [Mnemiopsis leidyi]
MAEFLASIFGTEKDRVNCPFYFKIGACCHGERCSRQHNKPTFSQTLLLLHMYQNPVHFQKQGVQFTEEAVQKHFDEFFADIYCELEEKYGPIDELNVCENLGDHLIGNVYCKFRREEDCQKAVDALNNRWYNGSPIYAELSPVTDFREASCRQHELSECSRGGFCNFMHIKTLSRDMQKTLGVRTVQHFTDWNKGGRGGPRGGGGRGGWGSRGGHDSRDKDRSRDRRRY